MYIYTRIYIYIYIYIISISRFSTKESILIDPT